MSDVTTRLEQVSQHLERAQRVLEDTNRVVETASSIHTAVEHARHTVRNVAIAGLVTLAVGIVLFAAARTRR